MSNSRQLTKLAAGLAAGLYTEDAIKEMLGSDEDVSTVVSLAAGMGSGAAAAALVDVAEDLIPGVEETLDIVDDAIDSINPFSDW